MKLSFVGLSCFLFEDSAGNTLAIDPFYDTPEYSLGLKLPEDFKADVFLVSHPDEDHSHLHHSFIRQRQSSHEKDKEKGISAFPDINIKGTLVKEYNGDLNIAWSFTVDDYRILHLADNAHILTQDQLNQIGKTDILLIPIPKAGYQTQVENIKALDPKIVIPSHLILPTIQDKSPDEKKVRQSIFDIVLKKWIVIPSANGETVDNFTQMFFAALKLEEVFDFEQVFEPTISIDTLQKNTPHVIMFRKQLGTEIVFVDSVT